MTNTPNNTMDAMVETGRTLRNPFEFKLGNPDQSYEGGIEVYDNFVDAEFWKKISEAVHGTRMQPSRFTWTWEEFQSLPVEIAQERMMETDPNTEILCDPLDNHQLNQTIWSPVGGVLDVERFSIFAPIIFGNLGAVACTKLRLNMTLHSSEHIENSYHTDWPTHVERFKGGKTAVLYMNTNNGYTKFKESGVKIESVENRLVVFPNHLFHTGATSTNTKNRIVLNINFI